MDMDIDVELETEISRRELQLPLLYEFRLGRKTTEPTSDISGTMNKDALFVCTAQRWFHRFKNESFALIDLPHTGRPLKMDTDLLQQLIEEDSRLTTWWLTEQLGYSHIIQWKHVWTNETKHGNSEFGYHMNYHRFSCSTGLMFEWNY